MNLFRKIFGSREQSLLYILNGKKPSILQWYVFRFTGSFFKRRDGKIVYLKPKWLFELLNRETLKSPSVTFKNGKVYKNETTN